MDIKYDILQFQWNKIENTFHADAWNLVGFLPDGSTHSEAFPTMKTQFIMYNYNTNGFRRFRFVKEVTQLLVDENSNTNYEITNWLFESEDGIKCSICVQP